MKLFAIRMLSMILFLAGLSASEYWQQRVDYKMNVFLDTTFHTIGGKSIIKYVNNSPDHINIIYMHLYANAFNPSTVKYREYSQGYGKSDRARQFTGKKNDQYFSRIEIQNYKISQGNEILADKFEIEGALLSADLNRNLNPGDSIMIELDWTHFIGEQFERAGRVGKQYNFAQWYPKMVVYDENGWFNTPFHAEGEFYGEFGNFEVSMNVPRDYIIGSSGVVMSGDPGWESVRVDTSQDFSIWEKTFEVKHDIIPQERREVTFFAENVHDFAWLTSPDFLYEHGQYQGIDVNVLFNRKNGKKWTKKVVARSESALEWLSTNFGKYPYPQVSTTDRLKSGGMEYPMLVMNGSESESLILHEIGHIWFYGILGNNEVREAWLDEGFTTFQTRWYMMNKYGPQGFDLHNSSYYKSFQKKYWKFSNRLGNSQWSTINFISSGRDEPIARSSYMFKNNKAYRENAYSKPSLMLDELKYILGDSVFRATMLEYYDRWNLKHTSEKNFISVVEDVSQKDMDWFFRPWLHNTRLLDYEIKNWSKKRNKDGTWNINIKIRRLGSREMPQLVEVKLKNGSIYRTWWKNHNWRQEDDFILTVQDEPAAVVLDPDVRTLDVDRRNNHSGRMGSIYLFRRPGMNYRPRDKYVVQWRPAVQYHALDHIMPGIKLWRTYGPWQQDEVSALLGSRTGQVFWSLKGWRKNPLGLNNIKINYSINDLGAVREFAAGITKNIEISHRKIKFQDITISMRITEAADTTRTDLFESGKMAVFMSALKFNTSFSNYSFSLEVAPGGWSDWSFSRLTFIENYDYKWNKYGLRGRGILGRIWSEDDNIPVQEKYTVEGAGSGDLYNKSYLRDESSFYKQNNLRSHYHLAGDANLRGFSGRGFIGVEQVMGLSLEGYFSHTLMGYDLELASFMDMAWLKGKKYAESSEIFSNTLLADSGLGLRISKTIFGQKIYLRIDFPIMTRIGNKSEIDQNNWLFSFQKGI